MKRGLFFLLLVLCSGSASAQILLLKNGNVIPADGLTRNGDMLMVSVKTSSGGRGQVGFNVADVAELNLPEPRELAVASSQIARGYSSNALDTITPIVDQQKTLRDLPGNWWGRTALVKIQALEALGRTAEAAQLITDVTDNSQSPEILTAAKLQLALATHFPDAAHALAAFDGVIRQSTDPDTLTQAWIKEGGIRAGEHEFDEALMDYVSVTVFYPDHNSLIPRALWGAAQAYDKLKDKANAIKIYQALTFKYPDTPEAILAKAELQKKASQ